MKNDAFAYAMLVVGIAILLFTFYSAYGLYSNVLSGAFFNSTAISGASTANSTLSVQNSSSTSVLISKISNGIVSDLLAQFPFNKYFGLLLAIILLALFASIGYKFAKLGIGLLSTPGVQSATPPKPQTKQQKS